MVDSTFEQEENERVARVALGFLSRFQQSEGTKMAVSDRFVTEHFPVTQLKRLQDTGALQVNAEQIDGVKKRIFDVTVLEKLAYQKLADVRKAGRGVA